MEEQEYDNLPQNIKEIVDSWDEEKEKYAECSRIQKELEQVGWTCNYGLDGEIFDVKEFYF